jgi:hypothetical protein
MTQHQIVRTPAARDIPVTESFLLLHAKKNPTDMVKVVHEDGSGFEAIWVDGFLPSENELYDIKAGLGRRDREYLERGGAHCEPALLFQSMAGIVKAKFHARMEQAGKPKGQMGCELFVVKPDDEAPWEPLPLREGTDEPESHYPLVLLNDKQNSCSCSLECMENMLRLLKYRERPDADVSDLASYTAQCKTLLFRIIEPYMSPWRSATRAFHDFGFNVLQR